MAISRKAHRFELFMGMMNVSAMFRLQPSSRIARKDVQRALTFLTSQHAILTHVIGNDADGLPSFIDINKDCCVMQYINKFLVWKDHQTMAPSATDLCGVLVSETRKTCNTASSLFNMHVDKYLDEVVFYFIVNHAITDGPSLFVMIDAFIQHLSSVDPLMSDSQFLAFLSAQDVAPIRDLLAELAEHPKCKSVDREFVDAAYNPSNNMLQFPPLTAENADFSAGGCINALFTEIDEITTKNILMQCKAHTVSFQSLLSTLTSLAFHQLVSIGTSRDGQDAVGQRPVYHFCPVNMRRYLDNAENNITSCMGGNIWLRQAPLGSTATVKGTNLWDIASEIQNSIRECADSAVPFQWLCEMQKGNFYTPHSIITSSMGIVPLKRDYGSITLVDVVFEAGVYAASEETFASPCVPEGRSGYGMLHAYTLFDTLRLTGSYYAYKESYIKQYFECVERMLRQIGSVAAGSERYNPVLSVDDLFVPTEE